MASVVYNTIFDGQPDGWVMFDERQIIATGYGEHPQADNVIDGNGMLLLPGAIDAHVHFREPGLTRKATIKTESAAARAGGVTAFFDMPNTVPQTVTMDDIRAKQAIAERDACINYAFFIGATNANIDELLAADYSEIPGVKLFMGSSTGNMLVDNEVTLDQIFSSVTVPIVVHAEDEGVIAACHAAARARYGDNPPVSAHSQIRPAEACVRATQRAVELCRRHPSAHLHIAHLSTADEVEIVRRAKADGLHVTAEVSPHHLLFTADDYPRLGSRIKMNPAIKTDADRRALRRGVLDGTIDIIATDHAPHTADDKQGDAFTAVSGAPMVQFSLPVILDLFGPEVATRTMAENPARIFGAEQLGRIAPGYLPNMVLIEQAEHTVSDADVLSKCGWTPLVGYTLRHRVAHVICTQKQIRFSR